MWLGLNKAVFGVICFLNRQCFRDLLQFDLPMSSYDLDIDLFLDYDWVKLFVHSAGAQYDIKIDKGLIVSRNRGC